MVQFWVLHDEGRQALPALSTCFRSKFLIRWSCFHQASPGSLVLSCQHQTWARTLGGPPCPRGGLIQPHLLSFCGSLSEGPIS